MTSLVAPLSGTVGRYLLARKPVAKHTNLLDPDNRQPRRFGNYILHGLLGEGGMARVYAGNEVLSNRPVAIKVLRTEFARSERGREQFLNEMGILARLDDPHIVRCLSCAEIEGQPVMVLEALEGQTLRSMLETRVRLPWAEAVGNALQIARALHAAHASTPSVIHRDLKPENVMCLPDGRIKVMDFGIAKILQALAGPTSEPIGTLQYMSPEHIDARPLDARADLFALGVVLWEMLVGRPPFASHSPRALLDQICTQPTPPLPQEIRAEVPLALQSILDRLLAKDPDHRPASAVELIGLLGPLLSRSAPSRSVPRQSTLPPPPAYTNPAAASPPLDTIDIIEAARKKPLQSQVEAQFAEAAEAASRFGRATSAWIVRALVSLMIFPAAAILFVSVPLGLVAIGAAVLMEDGVDFDRPDVEVWDQLPALLLLSLAIAAVLFMRTCWQHRRETKAEGTNSANAIVKPWFVIGAVALSSWAAATAIELAPDSSLYPPIHDGVLTASFIWMMITLSWGLGRVASRVLHKLERARAPS